MAIVAFAALFLFATVPANGANTTFVIRSDLSSVVNGIALDFGGGVVPFTTQFAGSDTVSISGTMLFDIDTPNMISMASLGGGLQTLGIGAPGIGNVPGRFSPNHPADAAFPGGFVDGANFGQQFVGAGLINSTKGITQDFVTSNPGPRPLDGSGFFDFTVFSDPFGDFIFAFTGRTVTKDINSNFDQDDDFSNSVIAALGTGGILKPRWEPSNLLAGPLGTLTIPIQTLSISGGPTPTPSTPLLFLISTGVIIATPIPEPSSLVLLGFGVVGLLTYGWRLRKRRV